MSEAIIGWDVGGAHLKAARVSTAGMVEAVVQVPCALWRGIAELQQAMATAARHVGQSERHAVTMTGEMVDLFPDRMTGVTEIARFMDNHLQTRNIIFYCGDRTFVASGAVISHAAEIASANWRASAEFVANKVKNGVFVDIGSTTTDIIAIVDARPSFQGRDDYSRLLSGELVYCGIVRTPLMAVSDCIDFGDDKVPIVAEHFATTADVYRVLNQLPDHVDQHPSADGAEKTPFASARRIARMIGRDVASATLDDWRDLAMSFRTAQLAKMKIALNRISPGAAPLIGAGIGAFLVREIAREKRLGYRAFAELVDIDGATAEAVTHVAPAVAVALLARES